MPITRNISKKCWKQLLDTANKTGVDALKSSFKRAFHKAAEATGQFVRNKIVEKIVIPPGKIAEILNKLRQVL